jgi:hypothetical protein
METATIIAIRNIFALQKKSLYDVWNMGFFISGLLIIVGG